MVGGVGGGGVGGLGLSDEEIEVFVSLDPGEQAELLGLLGQAVGDVWELTAKQELTEVLWGKVDWLLFGGSAGGGKSELAVWHANRLSLEVPGHVSLLVRQSIPELRRSLVLRLLARVRQFGLPARLRKVDGQTGFHYENGSLIECGYLASDEHLANFLSAEYDLIVVDEASLLTADQLVQLAGRLRTTRVKAALGARPHLGMFTNPGGAAHGWLYDYFVVPTDYGRRIVVYNVVNGFEGAVVSRVFEAPCDVRGAGEREIYGVLIPWLEGLDLGVDPACELAVGFVPSRAVDNPHLDPSYLKVLNALPERRRRQLRDGDWDTFEGQFFSEWRQGVHVVEPFEIPEGWFRARGVDFGSAAPWCCLWGAWDNDGNCYVYRELYGAGLTAEQQAKQAEELSWWVDSSGVRRKERYERTVADPSVFSDRRGAGRSVAQLWAEHGFRVSRAKNDRVGGWQNVRQYLWDYELQRPRLFVFSTCRNLIRTFPKQQHSSVRQDDMDSNGEDHALDALRYLLAVRPLGSRPVRRVSDTLSDRLADVMRRSDRRGRGFRWM